MFQLKNIDKDGLCFQDQGYEVELGSSEPLFVSLQVIELNVDSLIASFQQCEIGKRITKFLIDPTWRYKIQKIDEESCSTISLFLQVDLCDYCFFYGWLLGSKVFEK